MRSLLRIPCAMLLLAAAAATVRAAEATRFAAPDVATAMPSGSASGIGHVTFALLLVLASVFVVAYLVRRLRAVTGGGSGGIEVLAQVALGTKERAVIVRVGETRLLLGVASGQVTLLHTLPREENLTTSPQSAGASPTVRPGFAELLKKSLGR